MAKLINGEKRGRPGRWLLDYYDGGGKRRMLTFGSKDEASAALAKVLTETRQQDAAPADFNLTTGDYAARWLDTLSVSVKPRSHESYSQNWRLHLEPRFGRIKLRSLRRSGIQGHLVGLLKDGMSRGTVRLIHSVLRAMLNAAVADGLLSSNPADRIGRSLKLGQSKAAAQEEIKALDREQCARLLAAAKGDDHALLLLLARTGLRVSEAIGLEWTDLDLDRRQITVSRATSRGETSTPKSGRSRTVDVSAQLAEALRHLLVTRKAQTLRKGWGEVPRLTFCTPAGRALTEDRIRGAMSRALAAAKLPGHFTPHCLRHTFASLLLQAGESPAYVQRQLGHASIQLTVDTYGRWLPMGNVAAVDRLDDRLVTATGSKVAISGGEAPQVIDLPALTEPHNSSTRTTGSRPASRRRCGRSARPSRRARTTGSPR